MKRFVQVLKLFIPILTIGITLAIFLGNSKESKADFAGCDRRLVVQLSGMETINPDCTGTVRLKFSNGLLLQKPFVYGQTEYEFFISYAYIGSIASSVAFDCDCSSGGQRRNFTSMPCNSYYFSVVAFCD